MGRARTLALYAGAVATLAACGGSARRPVDHGAAARSCSGGPTRPLVPREVVSVFRHHGFSATSTTTSVECDASIAYVIANAGYDADPATYKRIQDTEGTLDCSLSRRVVFPGKPEVDLRAPAYSPIFSGRKAQLFVANLECVLYAGSARQGEQVARFGAAARQLVSLRVTRR